MNSQHEQHFKTLIHSYEERVISYNKLLHNYYKDKLNLVDPAGELKSLYREGKNDNERHLKELREELTYFRQGLNPPFMYKAR